MFYIEKFDKPNVFVRAFNNIKLNKETIIVPIVEEMKLKKIERLAMKTKKIIEKNSNSKKIVLSKEMQKQQIYINYLNMYGLEIQNGRWLFEILIPQIIEYIVKKKNIEKVNISILLNDLNEIEYDNIKILAKEFKTINIITNHIEKFKNLKKDLENEGIIITITNNKKKSLMKSDIAINIDFPSELLNKYSIMENTIFINVRGKIKINKKRFEGLSINNYEIEYNNCNMINENFRGNFYYRDIYEAELYKRQKINDLRAKIKKDNVKIKYLNLNNGKI